MFGHVVVAKTTKLFKAAKENNDIILTFNSWALWEKVKVLNTEI